MRQASLRVAACAAVLWTTMALATPTPQQQCDYARIVAWKNYEACVDGVIAMDPKGVWLSKDKPASFYQVEWFRRCRHRYFQNWTNFQSKPLLAGTTCIGSRFTDNGDGTVTDRLSGLVWEQKTTDIREYGIPQGIGPGEITVGPDGNLWFTETILADPNKPWSGIGAIGKVTPTGVFTEYTNPTGGGFNRITVGPDGNLWLLPVTKMTTDAVFTTYIWSNGSCSLCSWPIDGGGITAGADGNIWFTSVGDSIWKMSPAALPEDGNGAFTYYFPPTNYSGLGAITAGPDGNLWVTEARANKIAKVTTDGQFTEYPIPTADSGPYRIILGPDGNLWFTEGRANQIGKVTPAGVFSEYPVPTASSYPGVITADPDGDLWFTEYVDQIGKLTPAGVFTEYPIPTVDSRMGGITFGPDGKLWFTEARGSKIATIPADATLGTHSTGSAYAWSTGVPAAEDGTAFSDFLASVNAGFAGVNGWRVPTFAELQSIVRDFACPSGSVCTCGTRPCIDPTFGVTLPRGYWSATSYVSDPNLAWVVFFDAGSVDVKDKTLPYYTRAVRGGW